MQAFREFKAAWDPRKRMNPGKLIDANPVDADLRLGPDYQPVPLKTNFHFRSEVGNGFARAAEHCIGMGKCRSSSGGTMCPSYRATREERYSTRGRARLLAEMLRGEVITDGWASTRCGRRSTGASPAKAAAATAPRTPTWPRTRPSSSRTTTRPAAARGRRGRWAASASGRR